MKRALKSSMIGVYHYIDGVKTDGIPSALRGDVSRLSGDVDNCCISDDERVAGVNVDDLVVVDEGRA